MRFILITGAFNKIILAEGADVGLATKLFKGAREVKDNYSTNAEHRRYEIQGEASLTLEMVPDADIQYPSPLSVDLVKNLFLVEQTRTELKRLLQEQALQTGKSELLPKLITMDDMPF